MTKIQIGRLNQKASRSLSFFVVICMCLTVGMLYLLEKTERAGLNINSLTFYESKI